MTYQELKEYAATLSKRDIINHYTNYYSLPYEQLEELELMTIEELRQEYVNNEAR